MNDPLAAISGKGVSCVLDRESALGGLAELAGASDVELCICGQFSLAAVGAKRWLS